MLRKIAFALMLMLACVSCAWADYVSSYTASGSGIDSGDALWIVTAGDLARLRDSVNSGGESDGRYYVLSRDIHITASYWVAIGNQYSGNTFSGHFDGHDNTIHIQIRELPDYDENLLSMDRALFGCISTAEASEESGDYAVKNLKVAGFAHGYNAAGIVSRLSAGIIEGCRVSADLSVTELGGEDETAPSKINAGGIVAIIEGGTIRSCDFSGNIYAEGSNFSALAGGIAGAMTGGKIEGCTVKHYAVITAQGEDDDEIAESAGGIVAYVNVEDIYTDDDDTITGCMFEGGAITSSHYAGGIVGYAMGGQYTHNTVGDDTRIAGKISAGGVTGRLASGGYVFSNDIQGGIISSDSRAAGGIVGLLELGYVYSNDSCVAVRGDASYKGGVIGEINNYYGSSGNVNGNSYKGANYGIGIDEHANLNVDTGCTRLEDSQLYFVTPATLDSAMENESYSYTIELSQPAATSAVFTSLPSWMSYVTDGAKIKLTGIPTVTGEFSFTLEASYAYQTISRTFTVKVEQQLYIDGLDSTSANVGEYVSISPSINSLGYDISHSSFDWSIVSGEFPAGVSMDSSSGTISGIVASSGTYSIAIQATPENLSLTPASASMTIYVSPEFELDDDSTLPNAQAGRSYSHAISTNPSDTSETPLVWSISSGSLPGGVILGVYTGELTGTPTESGVYTFTVLAEGGNFTAEKEFKLTVLPAISITTDSALPLAFTGEFYSQEILHDVPAGNSVTWQMNESSSGLPAGLSFDTGMLAGIVSDDESVVGDYGFNVRITAGGFTDSKDFTLKAVCFKFSPDIFPAAVVGAEYSHDLAQYLEISGVSEDLITWSADSLPSGISLDSDGVISGIPSVSGAYEFAVRVILSEDYFIEEQCSLTVYPVISVVIPDEFAYTVKRGHDITACVFSVSPDIFPVTWSLGGSYPDGIAIGSMTGILSGTPADSGVYTFTVNALYGAYTAEAEITLTVDPALIITTDSTLPYAFSGQEYSVTLSHDAPSGNVVTWDADMPSGFVLDSETGEITGSTDITGNYEFTAYVSAGAFTASKDFTLRVIHFVISSDAELPGAVEGKEYSFDLIADGASAVWSADSLPSWLTLSADGYIYGTPNTAGDYSFTAWATSGDISLSKDFTITVYPQLSVSSTSDFPERVKAGGKISYTFTTDSDTPENISWSYSGTLPDGLTLGNLTGELTGTPTTAGTYTLTIIAVNGAATATQEITLIISPAITITTEATLPYALTGAEYSVTLEHDAPEGNTVTWAKLSGDIPDGLTLSGDTGVISGVASTTGMYEFTVQATAGAFVASKDFTLKVIYFLISSDAELPGAVEGKEYSFDLIADGASAVWSADSLPTWLTLSADGYIFGTPNTTGDYSFTAWATSGDISLSKDFTITVYPQLSVSDVSDFPTRVKAGGKISYTFTTDSDTPENISWSYSGTLPDGLTLGNLTGELTGTPTTAGTYTFTVIAVNGAATATQEITLIVSPAITITTEATLPYALTGAEYSVTLEHDAPEGNTVTWAKLSGDIPDGLTLSDDTGVISGVANEAGVYEFTLQATAGAFTASKDFTLEVIDFFISSDSQLPDASRGRIYSYQFTAHGLPETLITWSADEDALPVGLTFYNTGLLSGTALIEGSYTFTVQARSGTFTAHKTITLNVTTPITITTASPLPNAVKGVRYSFTLSHDIPAGNTPSWQVIAGTLPGGLSLGTETGIITGIPDTAGIYSFTVQLMAVKTVSKDFTLSVLGISSPTDIKLPDATLGTRYSFQLSADIVSADSQSLTWSADAGTLPRGLTLNTSGLLSGIPMRAGTSSFNVRAIIGDSISSDIKLTLTVKTSGTDSSGTSGPSVSIITSQLYPAETGKEYSATLESEPSGASWTLAGGFLPTGLSLSEDGKISGIPTQTGSFVFRVKASYPSYNDGEKQFSIYTTQGSDNNVSSSGGGGGGGCDSGMGTTALILSFMATIVKRKR